ncbi:MAG TPA: DoxX family protein [Gemmatimonadales bacterium]|nr:DoxX family protein [Gemmatimonadales bacterium]
MAPYAATLLRLVLGVVYVLHAYLATVLMGPTRMIDYQVKAGIPFPEIGTWYLIFSHGLGGVCLILGIFPRWAALVNVPTILGALLFVHLKNGFWITDRGYEYVLVLLVATIVSVMLGGGALTLRR